jgi:hypothetical protein
MKHETQAEQAAEIMGGDGQRWETEDGRTLDDVCTDMGAIEENPPQATGTWYRFPDNSLIVDEDGGWDVACPECGLWEEAGEHREECSRK